MPDTEQWVSEGNGAGGGKGVEGGGIGCPPAAFNTEAKCHNYRIERARFEKDGWMRR